MLNTANLYKWIREFQRGYSKTPEPKISVARWCIQQFCTCPHCNEEFDIIQTNLRRKSNQGTIKITQKRVIKFDKDKFEYDEVTTEIPSPPYYGAMMENTENLDEHIICPLCNGQVVINEAHWSFGR